MRAKTVVTRSNDRFFLQTSLGARIGLITELSDQLRERQWEVTPAYNSRFRYVDHETPKGPRITKYRRLPTLILTVSVLIKRDS